MVIKIFSYLSTDTIVGVNSTVVQIIQYIEKHLLLNFKINFAKSYAKKNGDSNSIIHIYINIKCKKLFALCVITIYTKK